MDSILETPVKRGKMGDGQFGANKGYDSNDDSGDDIFDEETVATVPLPAPHQPRAHTQANSTLASYPMPRAAQSSQLVEEPIPCSPPNSSKSAVQVAASSSPAAASPRPVFRAPTGGILARTMAPPGTAFRFPPGVKQQPDKQVIELSDDDDGEEDIRYVGGSSDDETQKKRDFKPAANSKPNGASRFSEIIASSVYKGASDKSQAPFALQGSVFDARNRNENQTSSQIQPPKRPANSMAGGYSDTVIRKRPRPQSTPSKARPVYDQDMKLEDIEDFSMRSKVVRIRMVLPQFSVGMVYGKLIERFGDENDTMDRLATMEEPPKEADLPGSNFIDLMDDDDDVDDFSQTLPPPKKLAAKQQLKAPARSLHQKYTSTQRAPAQTPAEKPKRKLMRGRKQPSSPKRRSSSPVAPPAGREESPISVGDSGIASSEIESPSSEFAGSLLNFFNTCSVANLSDLSSVDNDISRLIISKRPFRNLDQVRKVEEEGSELKNKAIKPGARKRQNKRRPVGEKVVDACEKMWAGYQAIDELVRECQKISHPVAQEMKKWGIDVYGSKSGELEMVTVGSDDSGAKSAHDSGIGTPKSLSAEDEADVTAKTPTRSKLFPQPSNMAENVTLKDYQVVGVNWLALLFKNDLSCILGDDMGLGKTCQVIAFLAHLLEIGIDGPHVIIVPASVIENWLREFQTFCPELSIFVYHASQKERVEFQQEIEDMRPNVIVTTYTIAKMKDDRKFLARQNPVVCVYDEGHALKNQESNAFVQLMKIRCQFRLLLTGTPLQNNLGELASLLRFILPEVFEEHEENLRAIFAHKATTQDHTHEALLSDQRVEKAKSILTPFILRRKKHQVLKHLPSKVKRTVMCDMTEWQRHVYNTEWQRYRNAMEGRARGDKDAEKHYNVQMALRKAAMHPLLHRYKYDDEKCRKMSQAYMKDPTAAEANVQFVYEDLAAGNDYEIHKINCSVYSSLKPFKLPGEPWMDSGKVEKLVSLVLDYKANGDRVLIFSQMVQVLNILEEVLNTIDIKFCRIDGNTPVEERQEYIDWFYDDTSITCFMLSTRAGGAGINLAAANKVIIFDSGYNPQDDIQAENRAHRVGQTRDVEVIRLITKGTIEEAIYALGETKLALDEKVAATEGDKASTKKVEESGMKEVQKILEQQMEGAA